MPLEIQSLIDKEEYEQALHEIETELDHIVDIKLEEQKYTTLLQLRVGVKQQLGIVDAIIRDQVKSDIFPSETNYVIDKKFKIKLVLNGIFKEKCDAYVHAVYREDPFQIGLDERSSIIEFIKQIKIEEIDKQIKGQLPKPSGELIILHHDQLSAPMSYHILFYSKEDNNIELLKTGIKNVLDDACKRNLKKISFFPLGYDLVHRFVNDNDREAMAEKLADKTAEIITMYLNENIKKEIPEIVFNLIRFSIMKTYEKAFNKWSARDKNYWAVMNQIEKSQKSIIEKSLTTNKEYIEKLKELGSNINEDNPILILGETGVGKSYLAKLIHENSLRAKGPLKKLNCSLVKSDRIYTILFGWKKGSFTGAVKDGIGAIGAAEGGTLFLDEIGYADLEVQEMLLKFVEEKKYSRFGEEEIERSAHVKLIFGTNVDIKKNIDNGTFANDLYERISNDEITIPPLRQRKEDIPLLVDNILRNLNENNNIKVAIPETAMEILKDFNWPGNIRQLQSYIEKITQKVRKERVNIITPMIIKKNPPRNELRIKNTLSDVEEALFNAINSWKAESGNLLDEIILPVLSKVYVKDFNGKVKESGKLIGVDGTRGNDSTLSKNLEKYNELIKKNLLG